MDVADVYAIADPAKRLEALRERGRQIHKDFMNRPRVRGIRSFDLVSFPFLSDAAFWRANFAKNDPWRTPGALTPVAAYVDYRMVLVQDAEGARLILNPLVTDPEAVPVYKFFGRHLLLHEPIEAHLEKVGLRSPDIDFLAFDHLHLQDLRLLRRIFPNSRILVQEKELEWARRPHPVDAMFYCPGGAAIQVEGLQGPFKIGKSMALLPTPGHTPGHQTLVVRAGDGVATISENGLSVDHYHPTECGIDGVKGFAHAAGQEVLPIANTFWSPQAQYDSMVLEKHVASPYQTWTTAALSDTRRLPGMIFPMALPRVTRFTPRLNAGNFLPRVKGVTP